MYHHCYEDRIPVTLFLIYCGYVLVDERQENYKFNTTLFEYENKPCKFVGYCSKAIDNDYIEYLKSEYSGQENVIEDAYETENIEEKELIDEILEKVKK